ncbi:Hsp20/alpha crystallin family protein (plasmid) [Candidatus Trichorickettsia mobilis]|uniref:Hsp20/alpha crystallin family protein n=1 Tax=Candidatus Trichorickettsia mobilis TaxID=1346319 RepID=UPI002B263C95|nr:Hsp20/alpha crystallin family protein [Candidatus Trichorickettsia mobilis]WPY01869.1 Hsp20/alpha crystallin family protein [Candidatus Trichorickettsia mobilis]
MTFNLPNVHQDRNLSNKRKRGNIDSLFNSLLDDFFYPSLAGNSQQSNFLSPRMDISETDAEYKIEVELPGIKQQDIEVKMDNNILTIKGQREEEKEEKERTYYTRERYYGSFQRSVSLPNNVNPDDIEAKFDNGILHIQIPKKPTDNSKRIEIKG